MPSAAAPDADAVTRLRAVLATGSSRSDHRRPVGPNHPDYPDDPNDLVEPDGPDGPGQAEGPDGAGGGRARAGAWSRILAARWSLPTSAGVAVLVLAAAVAATLVLRATATAPTGSTSTSRVAASPSPAITPGVPAGAAVTPPGASASALSAATALAAPTALSAATALAAAGVPVATGSVVVVDVVGAVGSAGLVRLPAGSRVDDALRAAGGPLPSADLAAINRARPLVDGEQVVVPTPGQVLTPAGASASGVPAAGVSTGAPPSGGAPAAAISLSTASAAQLDVLPGIGPVLAQRIVDYRGQHGITSVDDLGDVSGIGDKLLAKLRPLVTV